MADIQRKANVFGPISHPDIYEACRMEGARQLALHITSYVAFNDRDFHEVAREAKDALSPDAQDKII